MPLTIKVTIEPTGNPGAGITYTGSFPGVSIADVRAAIDRHANGKAGPFPAGAAGDQQRVDFWGELIVRESWVEAQGKSAARKAAAQTSDIPPLE